MKTCSKCKVEKPKSDFYSCRTTRAKDGLQRYCKSCKSNSTSTERYKKARNKRRRHRRLSDSCFRIKQNIRTRTYKCVKSVNNNPKKYRTFDWIGCEPDELLVHLLLSLKKEDRVNYLSYPADYHIDHIIPLATAKTEEQIKELTHYSNLQLLLAIENLKKGKKYDINREEDEGVFPRRQ